MVVVASAKFMELPAGLYVSMCIVVPVVSATVSTRDSISVAGWIRSIDEETEKLAGKVTDHRFVSVEMTVPFVTTTCVSVVPVIEMSMTAAN